MSIIISAYNIFAHKSNNIIAMLGLHVTSYQHILTRVRFRAFQVETNVHTSCESHDMNMDLVSFDNDFKELCTQLYVVGVLREPSH